MSLSLPDHRAGAPRWVYEFLRSGNRSCCGKEKWVGRAGILNVHRRVLDRIPQCGIETGSRDCRSPPSQRAASCKLHITRTSGRSTLESRLAGHLKARGLGPQIHVQANGRISRHQGSLYPNFRGGAPLGCLRRIMPHYPTPKQQCANGASRSPVRKTRTKKPIARDYYAG
jgi:hypothetical protein